MQFRDNAALLMINSVLMLGHVAYRHALIVLWFRSSGL